MPRAKPPSDGPLAQLLMSKNMMSECVPGLAAVRAGVAEALKHLPARATIGQLQAFLEIAHAGATGETVTVTSLRDRVGEHAHKTYQSLVGPDREGENSSGLAYVLPDERDTRRKYLFLTYKGGEAAKAIAAVMGVSND